MNQSDFLEIACDLVKAREKMARTRCDCYWFCISLNENWREILKPITKRSNRNRVITFDRRLENWFMYSYMMYRRARYADVLVGAPYFTDVLDEGRVYIYLNDGKVGGDISPE